MQIDNKQDILWTIDGNNVLYPATNGALNLVRNDNITSFIELGKTTFNQSNYIDFRDPTYTDYALRIIRGSGGASSIVHRGSGAFYIDSKEDANIYFRHNEATNIRLTSSAAEFYKNITTTSKIILNTNFFF